MLMIDGASSAIAVPELLNVSNIYGVQIANVGSPSIVSLALHRL
jgi:hypothetical protein